MRASRFNLHFIDPPESQVPPVPVVDKRERIVNDMSTVTELPVTSFDARLVVGAREVGVTIDVYGRWQRGYPGSRETPAEPKSLDVRRVLLNDHDITDWLSDDNFAEWFFGEVYAR